VPTVFAAGVAGREVVSNMFVNRASTDFQATQDSALAGNRIDTALAISSRNDRAHRAAAELGLVKFAELARQGEPTTEEARTALQQTLQSTIQHGLTAIDIDSANYQNWLVLAQVYDSLAGANVTGAYEEAKVNYERAFERNPSNPIPKLRLGQLAIAQNDIEGARTYLQEALALKPDFAAALFLLSQVEASAGQGDAAVQSAAAAVQLVPEDPLGWFNLGYILYSGAVYPDAASALEQAVVRANDYSNAIFFLGMTYHQLQRPGEAIAAFQRVLELNPGETWIQEGIDALGRGEAPFAANQPGATSTEESTSPAEE
jgi:tetratricopeptide (TPR) repeat protein